MTEKTAKVNVIPFVCAIIFTFFTGESIFYLPGAPFLLAMALIGFSAIVFSIGAWRSKHATDQTVSANRS